MGQPQKLPKSYQACTKVLLFFIRFRIFSQIYNNFIKSLKIPHTWDYLRKPGSPNTEIRRTIFWVSHWIFYTLPTFHSSSHTNFIIFYKSYLKTRKSSDFENYVYFNEISNFFPHNCKVLTKRKLLSTINP